MGNFEKSTYIAIGIIILAAVITMFSCQTQPSTTTPPLTNPPSADFKSAVDSFHQAATDTGTASKNFQDTTHNIESAATQGRKDTPPVAKPILDPHWDAIMSEAGKQEGLIKNLDGLQSRLTTAETATKASEDNAKNWENKYRTDMQAWTDKYNTEHAALLKAESSATKELRAKYTWISIACFAALVICITLGISGFGGGQLSGIALGGAAASAIGLVIAIALIQTVALIPWIVGGIALVGAGLVVYQIVVKNKTITKTTTAKLQLQRVNSELVHTTEAVKPFMTLTGRKAIFGDGPVVGIAHVLQSQETRSFVKVERTKMTNLAPSVPLTVACDYNDGVKNAASNDPMAEM